MARPKNTLPEIVDVAEMPARRYGRAGADLAPLFVALADGKAHAIEGVRSEEDKRQWRRKLRRAAHRRGLGVETRYVAAESRLYFQGNDQPPAKPLDEGRPGGPSLHQ